MQIIGRAAQLQKVARISNGTSELFEAIACLGNTQRAISASDLVSTRKPPHSETGNGNPRAIDLPESHAFSISDSTPRLFIGHHSEPVGQISSGPILEKGS
ncbi:hypothetical protein [Sphingomonas sp. NFX23]|uniref:hypothetical protein n=1 Tax=Sphingomonas sp. NFX23 TaxID=2819532 RepID=UPI003CFAE58E